MPKTKFKWVIELEVSSVWVEDGFDPDAYQIQEAIRSAMLGYATSEEVKVRVLKRPANKAIAKMQGYQTVESYRADNWEGNERK